MDDRRFDALTRSLAEGTSRRRVLKALFGGAVLGGAAAVNVDLATATHCTGTGEHHCGIDACCTAAQTCCDGECCNGSCIVNGAGTCCETAVGFECGGECCPNANTCCAGACCAGHCIRNGTEVCCPTGVSFECGGECCPNANTCCDGVCCAGSCNTAEVCCVTGQTFVCGADCCDNATEKCCDGVCISASLCCPSLPDCGDCETCISGTCVSDCHPECEICIGGQCVDNDLCCVEFGGDCFDLGNPQITAGDAHNCCRGLVCCNVEYEEGGGGFICAECCDDWGCDKGFHCCRGQCIPDDRCCDDWDCGSCEVCIDGFCRLTGVPFGEACGVVRLAEGSQQLDCCDGLVCCGGGDDDDDDDDDDDEFNGRFCAECCGHFDCPKGAECKHGICQFHCVHDKDCADGTCCCKSGNCSKDCCPSHKPDKPKTPDKPAGGPVVDVLPSTGVGGEGGSGLLGAAAIGAAAAYLASRKLRDTPAEAPATED